MNMETLSPFDIIGMLSPFLSPGTATFIIPGVQTDFSLE